MIVGENLWSIGCQGYTSSPSEDPENKKRDGTSGFVFRKGPWFWKEISHLEMPKEGRGKTELGQIWGKARGSASPPGASCGIYLGNRLT